MESIIVGTAGHIDHGKTSLIKALTGNHLDSSPEEQERGITISLGFTHLDLPSKRIAFIDVPGHEKLIRTMISGACGLDAVMLCVSAIEGVMPQTREHLSILNILGISRGIIVLTMTDLADEETIEMAEMDIEESVAGTFLEGAPIIHTSAGPTVSGMEDLKQALLALPPVHHQITGPFRLPVDRVFSQKGFGTVVTGTARNGKIEDGIEVEINPGALRSRIRGIQVHGQKQQQAFPGQRIALNLAGINHTQMSRGSVITQIEAIPKASIIDATYTHLDNAPIIENGMRLRFLSGATEVLVRVTIIDSDRLESGKTNFVQMRSESPLIVMRGDRFILRRESPMETLGGGQIIDPWSQRIRNKNRAEAEQWLKRIHGGEKQALLGRRGQMGAPPKICSCWNITATKLDNLCYADQALKDMIQRVKMALSKWHAQNPLRSGIQAKELQHISVPHLTTKAFGELLHLAVKESELQLNGHLVQGTGFQIQLTPQQQKQLNKVLQATKNAGLAGVERKTLNPHDLIQYAIDKEYVFNVQSNLIHPELINNLISKLRVFFSTTEELQPSDFKSLTGLSRKYSIPLLEWLDQQNITLRSGNSRRLHPKQS